MNQAELGKFLKALLLGAGDAALREEYIQWFYQERFAAFGPTIDKLPGKSLEEKLLVFLDLVIEGEILLPQDLEEELAAAVPDLEILKRMQVEYQGVLEQPEKRAGYVIIKALFEVIKKEAAKKTREKPAETELPLRSFIVRPTPPLQKTSPAEEPAPKKEAANTYLWVLAPQPFLPRIFGQFGLLFGQKENTEVNLLALQKALSEFKKAGYGPGSLPFRILQGQLLGWAGSFGKIQEAQFLTEEGLANKQQVGEVFQVLFDFDKKTAQLFRQRLGFPVPGLAFGNVFRNLSSKAGVAARSFFTNPRLSWLRLSLGGALGFGALATPSGPARVLLFGSGLLIASPEIIRGGGGAFGGILRGTANFTSGLLTGLSGKATVPFALIAGAVGFAILGGGALTLFTVQTHQGAYLEEAAAEVPSICLPPVDEFPQPFPAPPGLSFSWPVHDPPRECTSPYGYRLLDGSCNQHEGIDIKTALSTNTQIWPIAAGEVYAVASSGVYGSYVVLKHAGMYSLYAHLSQVFVSVGDLVNTSTPLGLAGDSGNSDGVHLHLSVSSCGSVPNYCFVTNSPNPCEYLSCPPGCVEFDKSVCGDVPICR